MTLAVVTVIILLGQAPRQATPAPPAPPPINCQTQTDPAVLAFCEGQDALRGTAKDRAVTAFRRAADLARDPALKKRALDQLEILYGPDQLDQPHALDPILRELMALSHGDLAPWFRLAKLQERLEQFDAAESTLLGARQQKPDDPVPWRELAQFFTRRAGALTAIKDSEERAANPDGVTADKDGIYEMGGAIEGPQQIGFGDATPISPETVAAGFSGTVGLEIVIDQTGSVASAKVVRSVPGQDAAALAMVKLWRFRPAMLNGRPVPVRLRTVVKVGG
jgi:TonB family protein